MQLLSLRLSLDTFSEILCCLGLATFSIALEVLGFLALVSDLVSLTGRPEPLLGKAYAAFDLKQHLQAHFLRRLIANLQGRTLYGFGG